MVTKIDLCSRSTSEFLKLQDLFKINILFIALDLPISAVTTINKLINRSYLVLSTLSGSKRREHKRRKTVTNQTLISNKRKNYL